MVMTAQKWIPPIAIALIGFEAGLALGLPRHGLWAG
jgi:hypothetical protein